MLCKLNAVAKSYGNTLVVKNVTCTIEAGKVTILAGPNGAGKTTLLKIMAGLSRPTSGSVEYNIPEDSIGYVGHQTFIYPDLSAMENLAFWAKLHTVTTDENTLLSALKRVELKRYAFERAGSFSRGMAQRLNLARVFLLKPQLILLDEPATGLDVQSMAILYQEIAEAKERGAGLVWISHSVASDISRADAVLAIKDKQVEYFGSAKGYTPEQTC